MALYVVLGTIVLTTNGYPASPEHNAPAIRKAIVDNFLARFSGTHISESEISPEDVLFVVKNRLNSSLLRSLQCSVGINYQFNAHRDQYDKEKHYQSNFAVLILTYDHRTKSSGNAERLHLLKGYFKRTKILTPFSYTVRGRSLVIAFTENGADKELLQFINAIPRLLESVGPG